MHVHRVIALSGTDPPPADRVADSVGELFGVRPRPSVDHDRVSILDERIAAFRPHLRVLPPTHDEDAVVGLRTVRIDDQCTIQLAVVAVAIRESFSRRGRPVVIRPWTAGAESHFASFAGRQLNRVVGTARTRVESVQEERRSGDSVAHGDANLGAFAHANDRPRDLRRTADFCECLNTQPRAVLVLRVPDPFTRFQIDSKHPVTQTALGKTVVADGDFRELRGNANRGCRPQRGGEESGEPKHTTDVHRKASRFSAPPSRAPSASRRTCRLRAPSRRTRPRRWP